MRPVERWGWPAAGLMVAGLLALSSPFAAVDRLWLDASLRALAPEPAADAHAVVLDIDAGSLAALQPLHGPSPLPRGLHAAVAARLLDAGALAVVFNLDFGDPRPDDDALAALAASRGRMVFGAALAASPGEAGGAGRAVGAAWRVPPLALQANAVPVGAITLPLDDDGRLRCLPAKVPGGDEGLPALPLAALRLLHPEVAPPGDAGCLLLRLPARADAVPALPYAAFATEPAAAAAAARVNGRAVFVGSPSLLEAPVRTAWGEIGGTQWQALAYEALRAGWVLAPASAGSTGLLLVLALVPAAMPRRWLPGGGPPGVFSAAALAVFGAVAAIGFGLQAGFAERALVPLALLLGVGALAGRGVAEARALAAERERARVAQAAAEAASRAKSEFLAHVSHDIRTPLNALIGVAQVLARTPLSTSQQRLVEVFTTAGAHLQRLIDDLLDLSRAEAGQLTLLPEPFAPRALADELVALFESRAQAKGLELKLDYDAGLPAWVHGDRHRLRQALVNVLGNALKFTERGGLTLTVARMPPGDAVEWVVHDTGIGVPPERLAAIFEPFTQADAGVARSHGGSGLGLAITRRLVQAMGGEVAFTSRVGEGSSCRIRLPLPGCEPPAPVGRVAREAAGITPRWAGRRVLLAEDHPHNVLVAEGLLADTGIAIEVVGDGQAAVERVAAGGIDLVLMDMQMPRLDGLAATRAIRAAEAAGGQRRVPVVALSASAFGDDRQASLDAGCDDHVGKPVAREALFAALEATLGAPDPLPASDGRAAAPPEAAVQAAVDTHGAADSAAGPGDGLQAAIRRLGGDQALYMRVAAAARVQLRDWEPAFEAAAEVGDRAACRHLAHDLKSLAATLGDTELAAAAQALEAVCAGGEAAAVMLHPAVAAGVRALRQRLAAEAGDGAAP